MLLSLGGPTVIFGSQLKCYLYKDAFPKSPIKISTPSLLVLIDHFNDQKYSIFLIIFQLQKLTYACYNKCIGLIELKSERWALLASYCAATSYHKLDGLKQYKLVLLQFSCQEAEMGFAGPRSASAWQHSFQGLRGRIHFHGSSIFWRVSSLLGWWPHHHFPVHVPTVTSPSPLLSHLPLLTSYKDTCDYVEGTPGQSRVGSPSRDRSSLLPISSPGPESLAQMAKHPELSM